MVRKIVISNGDWEMSQEAAAILAGVTVQTLNNWSRQENPPPQNPNGGYSAKAYGAWLTNERGKKRGVGRPPAEPKSDGRGAAEARLTLAKAIKAERDNEIQEGLLIPIDEVETTWQSILMRVKSAMTKIPSVLAPVVLGDTDLFSIEGKLKDAVNDALSEASEDWRDGIDTDDD